MKACGSEDDRVVVSGLKLTQTGVHIPAKGMQTQIGPQCQQLCLTAEAAGPDTCSERQSFDARETNGTEHVARILAPGDGRYFKIFAELSREIFETVHREVDTVFDERLFDLFGEHSFGADLCESDVGDLVAGGLDDLDFDPVTLSAEQFRDVLGLP